MAKIRKKIYVLLTQIYGQQGGTSKRCHVTRSKVAGHDQRRCFNSLLGDGDHDQALLAETSVDQHVRFNTPPTFIWATTTDARISVNNSLRYATALQHAKVPFALYLFPTGPHGLGMAIPELAQLADEPAPAPDVQQWPTLFLNWIQEIVTQK